MSQGDVEARVVADTTGLQAGMVQAAIVTEAQMKKIAQYVKAANDQTSAIGRASQKSAGEVQSAYSSIAANADHVRSAHAGVNRELLVLTHELSQGNFSRFGGSMLVLAERTNALEYAMTASGAAILGATVAGVAFVALAAMGAIEADKFAKSLQLTGNYAALTQTSLDELARAQAKQTGQSTSAARASIEAAAGTGAFGPASIAAVSRAMGDYQKITGEAADEVVGKFKTIQDGVAKWAEEQNKQVHFLTLGQFDYIKSLEETGNKEQAAVEALNLMAQTMESRATPAVGALAATWNFLKQSVQDAGQAIADIGKPSTIADHIADVQRQIQWNQSGNAGGSYADRQRALIPLQAELAVLMQDQFRSMERLADASTRAQQAEAGIAGQKAAEEWIKRGKAVSAYNEALEKFHANVKAAADAGKPFSPLDVKSGEDAIKKQFENHALDEQSNQYANLMATIKAFNATTDEEVSRMGKLTDAQKFSIQAHEELTKAGKKLSDQQRATIASAIDEAAAQRTVADMLLAAQKATIERVRADTANQEQQQRSIESVIQAGNDQANAILRQSQLIGRSTDEVRKIQELQKFDDLVGKALLGADNDTVTRINEVAAVIRGNLVDSLDAAKKAQDDFNASFDNGWNKAQADFVKQAANSAAYGEKVYNDFTSSASDAIVKFAETGKLSFDSLVKTIIDDLIRMEVQKGFASLAGFGNGSTSAIASLFASFGAGGGGGGSGGVSAGLGVAAAAGFANGIDYVPYDGMLATLHEGERVTSRQDAAVERNGRGGVSIPIDMRGMSFGAGVDAAGVTQAVRTGMAQAKAEIYRQLNTGTRR